MNTKMNENKENNQVDNKVIKRFFDVKVKAKIYLSANTAKGVEVNILVYAENKITAEEAGIRYLESLTDSNYSKKDMNAKALPTTYHNVIEDTYKHEG